MDLSKLLHQLREDLANLDTAIASLERLEQSGKRGRPRGTAGHAAELEPLNRPADGRKRKRQDPPHDPESGR